MTYLVVSYCTREQRSYHDLVTITDSGDVSTNENTAKGIIADRLKARGGRWTKSVIQVDAYNADELRELAWKMDIHVEPEPDDPDEQEQESMHLPEDVANAIAAQTREALGTTSPGGEDEPDVSDEQEKAAGAAANLPICPSTEV